MVIQTSLPFSRVERAAEIATDASPLLGACVRLEDLDRLPEAAVDFVELTASDLLQHEGVSRQRPIGFPVRAVRKLFPASLSLEQSPVAQVETHLARIARAACDLGVRYLVLGSGAARRWKQWDRSGIAAFQRLLSRLTSVAHRHNVSLLIEVLPASETNCVTTLAECAQVSTECDGVVLDFSHTVDDRDTRAFLSTHGIRVRHVHAAGRRHELPTASEELELARWIDEVLDHTADAVVSVELHALSSVDEMLASVGQLRRLSSHLSSRGPGVPVRGATVPGLYPRAG